MSSKIQPNKCLFSSLFVTIIEILLTFMYTELTETGSFKDYLNANETLITRVFNVGGSN
jgi:hypothetical protein